MVIIGKKVQARHVALFNHMTCFAISNPFSFIMENVSITGAGQVLLLLLCLNVSLKVSSLICSLGFV